VTIGRHVHSVLHIKAPQRFTLYFGSLSKSMVTIMRSILMPIIPVDIGSAKVLCIKVYIRKKHASPFSAV